MKSKHLVHYLMLSALHSPWNRFYPKPRHTSNTVYLTALPNRQKCCHILLWLVLPIITLFKCYLLSWPFKQSLNEFLQLLNIAAIFHLISLLLYTVLLFAIWYTIKQIKIISFSHWSDIIFCTPLLITLPLSEGRMVEFMMSISK